MITTCQICERDFATPDQWRLLCAHCQAEAIEAARQRRAMIERDHTAIFNAPAKPATNPTAN